MVKLVNIGVNKYASLSYYRREPYINLREYVISQDGTFIPTKKGFLMTPAEWQTFKTAVSDIDKTVAENTSTPLRQSIVKLDPQQLPLTQLPHLTCT